MRDLLGAELKVGDEVIIPAKRYRHLVKGVIRNIGAKKATVAYTNNWNYPAGREETLMVTSDQMCGLSRRNIW